MIGLINIAVQAFTIEKYGIQAWQQVVEGAGLSSSDIQWVTSCPYPDSVTYNLITSSAKLLGITPDQALEQYGQFFVDYLSKQGYGKLMQCLGSNIAELLHNLNNLHQHLALTYPQAVTPYFRCENVTSTSLDLHYVSCRPGLSALTAGIIKGAASQMFNITKLDIKLIHSRSEGHTHEVFRISYPQQKSIRSWDVESADIACAASRSRFSLQPELMQALYPYHFIIDHQGTVIQVGQGMRKLAPCLQDGININTCIISQHPHGQLCWSHISSQLNSCFILRVSDNADMQLKGSFVAVILPDKPSSSSPSSTATQASQASAHSAAGGQGCSPPLPHLQNEGQQVLLMQPERAVGINGRCSAGGSVASSGRRALLFLGAPRVADISQLAARGLTLSDLPVHDASRRYAFALEQRHSVVLMTKELELFAQELQETNQRLEAARHSLHQERARSRELVHQLLPRAVAECLEKGERFPPVEHPLVALLQVDIIGFTRLAASSTPLEVCALLDELYMRFDALLDQHPSLYKLHTAGDSYTVVCNVSSPCSQPVDVLLRYALDMLHEAGQVATPGGAPVMLRAGLHAGPAVGCVLGRRMPRYCLLGDTVLLTTQLESLSLPGQVHLSQAALELLHHPGSFHISCRGPTISHQGQQQHSYTVSPTPTIIPTLPAAPAAPPRVHRSLSGTLKPARLRLARSNSDGVRAQSHCCSPELQLQLQLQLGGRGGGSTGDGWVSADGLSLGYLGRSLSGGGSSRAGGGGGGQEGLVAGDEDGFEGWLEDGQGCDGSAGGGEGSNDLEGSEPEARGKYSLSSWLQRLLVGQKGL